MLQLYERHHYGSRRLYFSDAKVQTAYVQLTGRRTVSPEMIAFLRVIGVGVAEPARRDES